MIFTGKADKGYTGTKKVTYKINAYDLSKNNAVTVVLVNANGEETTTSENVTNMVEEKTEDKAENTVDTNSNKVQ